MKKYHATMVQALSVLFTYICVATFSILSYSYNNLYLWILFQALVGLKGFLIFHDCCHNSFSQNKTFNKILKYVSSTWCWTPVYWGNNHRLHHANSGNLNTQNYNWNDTLVFTKKKYVSLTTYQRLAYRILRHPLCFFLLAPIGNWFIKYRLPVRLVKHVNMYQKILNNICLGILLSLLYKLHGGIFLYHYMISNYISGIIGIMLFHMQHVFNPSYVQRENWKFVDSALKGSSYIHIPIIFRWFTMGIQYHHVHHYNTSIPGYNLGKCHNNEERFQHIEPLSLRQMIDSLSFTLYDEEKCKFVSINH